jgi:cytochrome c5
MSCFFRKNIYCLILSWFFILPTWSESHHPQEFLKSVAGSKTEGLQIVQHYCVVCHAEKPMIQIGAPKIGDATDWQLRLKQGMATLFLHTENGINAMPARGGCFECSDEQLKLAILAMLPAEKSSSK